MTHQHVLLLSRAGGNGWLRPTLLCVCYLFAAFFCRTPVAAQDYIFENEPKKVALVIGNENYRHLAPLPSARADGEMMTQRLREIGFEVDYYPDVATVEQFEDVIIPVFRAKLAKGAFVVFFFSGHGFSYGPDNFLAPTRMPLSINKSKVTRYAIAVDAFKDLVATYRPGLVMVFVDACRSIGGFVINDELGRNVVSKGYKEPKNSHKGVNSYIVYATKPGEIAAGSAVFGQMSIFTQGLHDRIGSEGQPFDSMINDVSAWVLAASNGEQDPGNHDWSKTDPYFKPTAQNLEDQKRLWLAALDTRDALQIETFFHRYSVSRHAAASRQWLADDLYKEKPDPHTSVSPAAVERAWSAPGEAAAGIRRLSISSLAFKRSVEASQERELRLLSDEEIGLVSSAAAPRAGDSLQFSVAALDAHGTVVATRDLEARTESNTSAAATSILSGAELQIQGKTVGADGDTYMRVMTRDVESPLLINVSQFLEQPRLLYLGQSLLEIVALPRSDGNHDLVDDDAIEEAVAALKARGLKTTWVSLSTAAAEDESERDARALRLADAAHVLKRAGVEGTRITTVSGVDDFVGGGVRLRFFGIR